MTGKYELAFWGGSEGVRYRRYHRTMEQATDEAHRVHNKMENRGAHIAIVYDAQSGKQLRSIP